MIRRQAMRKTVCITAEIICERGMASQLGRWEEQGVSVVKKERINREELPGRSWYKIRACGTATIRSAGAWAGPKQTSGPTRRSLPDDSPKTDCASQTLSIERVELG